MTEVSQRALRLLLSLSPHLFIVAAVLEIQRHVLVRLL